MAGKPRGSASRRSGTSASGGGSSSKGPANTAAFVYLDTPAKKRVCAKDKAKIEAKCKPEAEDDKKKKLAGAKGKSGSLLSKLKLPSMPGGKGPASQWISDHCEFLMIKPGSPGDLVGDLNALPGQMAEALGTKAMEAVRDRAQQALESAIKKKLAKMALKQGIVRVGSFLAGPWVGIAVNIAMSADAAYDVMKAAEEFPELKRAYEEATKQLEQAQQKIKDLQGILDEYKNKSPQELVSDVMYGAAELNDCVRARRCMLVPYNQTKHPAALNGKGCCPGQTGHHVLPSSMFDDCAAYKPGQAPTICVEGVNNSHGSHGVIHRKLGGELGKVIHVNGKPIPPGAPMSKKDAIDAGAKSVQEAFPLSGCDPDCIKAQLRTFYDKLNCTPKNMSGLPGGSDSGQKGKTK